MSSQDSKRSDGFGSKRLSTSGTSLYAILELPKGATQDEIKKAYRKLALRFHPDKNREDPNAADKFKEINRANSVLNDPQRRTIYDRYGSFGINLVNQVGQEKAAFLLRLKNPCVKILLLLACVFTGCCYCCFCYCFCCCNFFCGKCAPEDELYESEPDGNFVTDQEGGADEGASSTVVGSGPSDVDDVKVTIQSEAK